MTNTDAPEVIQISSEDGEEPLVIESRMREIPGRRFSGRGRWRDQTVFYKVFVAADRAARHAARECSGAAALLERKIPGGQVIFDGAAAGPDLPQKSRVVLFDWLDGAENLDQLLRSSPSETRALSLLRDLARLIGRHHVAGIVQRDLHFANFAIVDDVMYTFDAASIEVKNGPVSRGTAFDNLAIYFAQIDPGWDSAIPTLLDAYVEVAGAEMRPDLEKLWRRTLKERRRRMEKFLDKVLRPCRRTEVVETDKGKVLVARDDRPEDLLALVNTVVAMANPSDGLGVEFRGATIRLRVFGGGLARRLVGDTAKKAWRNSHRLCLEGVSTPRPLACGSGWFLAEQPSGATLESLVAEAADDLDKLTDEVAHILQRLDQLGLEHGQLGRRSFVRLPTGVLGLTDLEELEDRPPRGLADPMQTSADMMAAIECWKGSPLHDPLLAALQRRGYALDLL